MTSVIDLSTLKDGVDYQFSTGGLTRMVYPLVNRMLADGTLQDAHWISLNPSGPETVKVGGITLHNVSIEKDRLAGYGNTKETIWGAVHGINATNRATQDAFWSDDFSEFAYYNRVSAELMTKLDEKHDFDLFYIHDFQQLPAGKLLMTLKPKIFRWHIPFDESMIPSQWKNLLTDYFNNYDMVIVSSTKYLTSLKSFGYSGRVRKIYPFIDPQEYSKPGKSEIEETSKKLRNQRERQDDPFGCKNGSHEGSGSGNQSIRKNLAKISGSQARTGGKRKFLRLWSRARPFKVRCVAHQSGKYFERSEALKAEWCLPATCRKRNWMRCTSGAILQCSLP